MDKINRSFQFIFRVSEQEREAIKFLAERLNRSQGDAVRVTVMEKVEALQSNGNGKQPPCEE